VSSPGGGRSGGGQSGGGPSRGGPSGGGQSSGGLGGVVLDTDVLIDFLRGLPAAGQYVGGLTGVPTCSEVTRVEVLRGMRAGERRATERLLATLRWVVVDDQVSGLAGEMGRRFRRSHGVIAAADLLVAATAERLGLPLATLNVRHYPMFVGLEPAYRR
jgi:predicted nucleic acid-binding protein